MNSTFPPIPTLILATTLGFAPVVSAQAFEIFAEPSSRTFALAHCRPGHPSAENPACVLFRKACLSAGSTRAADDLDREICTAIAVNATTPTSEADANIDYAQSFLNRYVDSKAKAGASALATISGVPNGQLAERAVAVDPIGIDQAIEGWRKLCLGDENPALGLWSHYARETADNLSPQLSFKDYERLLQGLYVKLPKEKPGWERHWDNIIYTDPSSRERLGQIMLDAAARENHGYLLARYLKNLESRLAELTETHAAKFLRDLADVEAHLEKNRPDLWPHGQPSVAFLIIRYRGIADVIQSQGQAMLKLFPNEDDRKILAAARQMDAAPISGELVRDRVRINPTLFRQLVLSATESRPPRAQWRETFLARQQVIYANAYVARMEVLAQSPAMPAGEKYEALVELDAVAKFFDLTRPQSGDRVRWFIPFNDAAAIRRVLCQVADSATDEEK
ncbi:MAG: hypothetical protein AB7P04_08170 [Bacteriovoracia bacterium]